MIRVCNIIEEGRYGGAQARIVNVAGRLKKKEIYTTVIFPARNSERLHRELQLNEINFMRLSLTRMSWEKKEILRYLAGFIPEIISLYRILRKEKFDLVHVNTSYQIKGAIAARISGTPVVWHLNDTRMTAVVRLVSTLVMRLCARGFIVAGKRVYDYYIRDGRLTGFPCFEIQAPVDTSKFNPLTVKKDPQFSKYKGLKILTVANINPIKGIESFIIMAALLMRSLDGLHFFISGPVFRNQKYYFEKLQSIIKAYNLQNICFTGSTENVQSVMKAVDICVFTSLYEASPTAIWEAMSMAKPIVTTDVGSVNELIVDGESGFIVPVGDAGALAAKVELLISDKKFRNRMGKMARQQAVRNLDIDICVGKHIKTYEELLVGG